MSEPPQRAGFTYVGVPVADGRRYTIIGRTLIRVGCFGWWWPRSMRSDEGLGFWFRRFIGPWFV